MLGLSTLRFTRAPFPKKQSFVSRRQPWSTPMHVACYSDGEGGSCRIHGPAHSLMSDEASMTEMTTDCSKSSILLRSPGFLHSSCPPAMHKSCFCIRFIAEHTKITDDATKVSAGQIRSTQVRQGPVGLSQVKLGEDRLDQFNGVGARAKGITDRQNAYES